jgi:hypothetical protein
MSGKPKKGARKAPKTDIAILQGPTEDQQGARLLRFKDGEVFAGEVRPAREGQPIEHNELVRLRPLHPSLPVCEVEVLHAPAKAEKAEDARSAGPARVSSPRYRRNWNAVFKAKAKTRSDWSLN